MVESQGLGAGQVGCGGVVAACHRRRFRQFLGLHTGHGDEAGHE
jgi:hypothetical protein